MKITWKYLFFCACLLCLRGTWGFASAATVGVIYPELREPYSKVFEAIIKGIEQQMDEKIDRYELANQYDTDELDKKIRDQGNQLLFALGVRGVKAVGQLSNPLPVVVGAILPSSFDTAATKFSGIFLVPDPELMFQTLASFIPSITQVSVVYNPLHDRFLIEKALKSGKKLGISVDARAVANLHQAARAYKDLLETVDHETNAIWLVQDASTLDSDVILPLILEYVWNRNLVLFSNSLVLTKRGALFSMYPDNLKMGKELAKLAESMLSNSKTSEIYALRALKTAVNKRTAKHLGIGFSPQQEKTFDLVFPQ